VAAYALVAVLLCGPVGVCAKEPSARDLYKRGRKYEKKKDYANAYLYYSKAAAADPAKKEYWQRAQALQRRAIEDANVLPAAALEKATDSEPVPEITLPEADPRDIRESRRPQPPAELMGDAGTRDFDIKADSRSLWEQVTKAYGLQIVFDGDYEAGQPQSFHITEAGYRAALHALMTATSSFIVPISEKLLMVVKDTEAKRREVENTVAVAIPIPEPFSVQEAQELGRSVQQLMEIQKFSIDSAQRMVVLRDRISKVRPAQLLFQELLHGRAQVGIEVQLLAWGKSRTRSLGTGIPTSLPIVPLIKTIALGGGPTAFGLGIASATLLANEAASAATTLYDAEVRSADGMPATLKVGTKYPIQTIAYIGEVPSGRQSFTPPPSFNFEDLGFNLKVTPKVHGSREVTLDIETEFKLLGSGSLNGIPVISNRSFKTQARLTFGEAAVISGLVSKNDFRTMSGPAGLMTVPVIGTLLGTTTWVNDDAEILLVMRPTLLYSPASETITKAIWIGSEGRPRLPM
jgi:general secretion pathway protein D